MWPGPYGDSGHGSTCWRAWISRCAGWAWSTRHLLQPPARPGHPARGDDERAGHGGQSGRALYAGISQYSPEQSAEAVAILRQMGVRLLIHQPSYSIVDRWIEDGLLDALERDGIGCIAFSPLAQGMLTSRYLDGIPGVAGEQGRFAVPDLLWMRP